MKWIIRQEGAKQNHGRIMKKILTVFGLLFSLGINAQQIVIDTLVIDSMIFVKPSIWVYKEQQTIQIKESFYKYVEKDSIITTDFFIIFLKQRKLIFK